MASGGSTPEVTLVSNPATGAGLDHCGNRQQASLDAPISVRAAGMSHGTMNVQNCEHVIEIATRSADAICGAICGATTAATNCLSLPYAENAENAEAARQHTYCH